MHQTHTHIKSYNKNINRLNCKDIQALFKVLKINQIKSVLSKILYVKIFRTPISAK